MTATTSNSKSFNLEVDEIIELALEPLGGEHITGKEARQARQQINLLLIDIQNKAGVAPLHALEQVSVALASGSSEGYTLPSQFFNVQDLMVRVSSANSVGDITDHTMERLSYDDWLHIPTKRSTIGRPTQFLVDKQKDNIVLNVWPVPDASNYSLFGWATTKVDDINRSYQILDLPTRYLDAVVKGLRYYMSQIRQKPLDERLYYKAEYNEALDIALSEDRERVDFDFFPYIKGQLGR